MNLIIAKTFQINQKIGSGAFGEIFHAINLQNNCEVAIKLESIITKHPQLYQEAQIYEHLNQNIVPLEQGIPQIYHYSTEGDFNIMVIDLLGPSLEQLFKQNQRKFSLKTVLLLAEQMINRVEFVHSKGFIIRDIDPENFLMGIGNRQSMVYLTDFGFSKRFTTNNGAHIEYKDQKQLIVSARYGSINSYLGVEQSRRDDLESIGYVLIYFLKGSLPWQYVKNNNEKDKYKRIQEIRNSTSVEQLCTGVPMEFQQFLNYSKNLQFDEAPNYELCRELFRDLFSKMKFNLDYQYDWSIKQIEE